MPNLKSAKKRMRQNTVLNDRNQQVRTRLKNARRTMMDGMHYFGGQVEKKVIEAYCSVLDKAAKGGVIKKNTAVRRKTNAANNLRKIAS